MKYIYVIDEHGNPGVIALSENLVHAEHLGPCVPVSAGFCDMDFSNPRGESTSLIRANPAEKRDERIMKTIMAINLH
jgi:hypothetical protein